MRCWLWDGTLLKWISSSHIPKEHRPSAKVSVSRFLWLYCCCSQRNNHPCLHAFWAEQWHQLREVAHWEEPTTKAFMQSYLCAWCPVPDRTLCSTTSLCWTDSVPWSYVPFRRKPPSQNTTNSSDIFTHDKENDVTWSHFKLQQSDMLFQHHLGLITVCISVSFIVMHEQAQLCSLECTATSVLFSPVYCRPTLERYLYNRMSINGRESTLKTPNMPRTNTNEATYTWENKSHFLEEHLNHVVVSQANALWRD